MICVEGRNYRPRHVNWVISVHRWQGGHVTNFHHWLANLYTRWSELLSDMRKAWSCLRADRLGLWLTDASTRAMLLGVRTEEGRPGGFLHETEPSSRFYFTHRRIAFGDGTSCWFRSRWNSRWVSVIDLVRTNSSTAHTRSLTPQRSMLTKSEGHCLCSNTCTPRYLSGEVRN